MKEALQMIKDKRPEVDPNIGFVGQLQTLQEKIDGYMASSPSTDAE